MGRLRGLVAGVLLATLLAAGGTARAQEDPTGGYDLDAVLHRQSYNISELPTKAEAEGRPITFELSLGGTYTTNAAASRFDAIDAGYLTPGFGINVTPVTLGGWEVGGGALIDADYYTGDYDDRFGEGTLEGFVFAAHPLGPGTLTGEVILLGVFDKGFSNQDFRLLVSNLTYSVARGDVSADFSAEYEDSDVPELRRTRLMATLGYTAPEPQLGYELSVEGDVIFSDFNGGAASGRDDTAVALALFASRELARNWSVEWKAGFINRFSNRKSARFTALDLVVELARQF